jgi:hypothetical protein
VNESHRAILKELVDEYNNNNNKITLKDNVIPLVKKKGLLPGKDIFDTEFEQILLLYFNCFSSLFMDSTWIFPYGSQTQSCCYYSLSIAIDCHPEKEYILQKMRKFVQRHSSKNDRLSILASNPHMLTDPIFLRKYVHLAMKQASDVVHTKIYEFLERQYNTLVKSDAVKETAKIVLPEDVQQPYRTFSKLVYEDENRTFKTIGDLLKAPKEKVITFIRSKNTYNNYISHLADATGENGCLSIQLVAFSWSLDYFPLIELWSGGTIWVPDVYKELKNYRPYTIYTAESVSLVSSCDFQNLQHEPIVLSGVSYPSNHEIPVVPIWQLKGKWDQKWHTKLEYVNHLERFFSGNKHTALNLLNLIDKYGGYPPDNECIKFESIPVIDYSSLK